MNTVQSSVPHERVIDIASGREPDGDRLAAMAILAASDEPTRVEILAGLLHDAKEPRVVRTLAATLLGRIAIPASQAALVRALGEESPPIRLAVLKSLGRIGNTEALATIEASGAIEAPRPISEAARFAVALIAHRHGLEGHDLARPALRDLLPRPTEAVTTIEIEPTDEVLAAEVAKAMKLFPLGVPLDHTRMATLRCSGVVNVVAVHRDFAADPSRAAKEKALFGVVFRKSEEEGSFSPALLVLTRPAKPAGTVDVLVVRAHGGVALCGQGHVEGANATFEIAAVRRPGARATLLRGGMGPGGVIMHEAISTLVAEPRIQVALTDDHVEGVARQAR